MRRWLLLLVACGSPHVATDAAISDGAADAPPTVAPIATSGSRLKITWYETVDGVQVPMTTNAFYDSARGETCTVWTWLDGHSYCAPVPASNDHLVYTDSACTMPVIIAPLPAPYVADLVDVGCDQTIVQHLYKPGPVVSPPALFWIKTGTTCGNPTSPNGATFYEAQEIIPSTDLVEITTTHVGTAPLQQVKWQGADGLVWPLARGYDTGLGAECAYQDVSATAARCTPAAAIATTFADSTCTTPKLDVPSNGCPTPTTVSVQRACGAFDPNVYAVASTTTASPLFDSRCEAATPAQGDTFYSVGDPIGTTTTLSRGYTAIAGQRLKPIFVGAADVRFWDFLLYDPILAIECGFATNAGGDTACVPPKALTIGLLYSDAGCFGHVDLVKVPPDPCSGTFTPPEYAWKASQQGYEIHHVGAQHTGLLYFGSPSECGPYDAMGQGLFEVDPTVVPWTSFEPAAVVIDP